MCVVPEILHCMLKNHLATAYFEPSPQLILWLDFVFLPTFFS